MNKLRSEFTQVDQYRLRGRTPFPTTSSASTTPVGSKFTRPSGGRKSAADIMTDTIGRLTKFGRAPEDSMGSDQMPTNTDLAAALQSTKTIPCIVGMTIHLSQPYYRKPIQAPVQRILAAMPNEPARFPKQATTSPEV